MVCSSSFCPRGRRSRCSRPRKRAPSSRPRTRASEPRVRRLTCRTAELIGASSGAVRRPPRARQGAMVEKLVFLGTGVRRTCTLTSAGDAGVARCRRANDTKGRRATSSALRIRVRGRDPDVDPQGSGPPPRIRGTSAYGTRTFHSSLRTTPWSRTASETGAPIFHRAARRRKPSISLHLRRRQESHRVTDGASGLQCLRP